MAEERRGWHPDPFGAHELRYFALNGTPTRLVRDADTWSHDVPLGTAAVAGAILRPSPPQLESPMPAPQRGEQRSAGVSQEPGAGEPEDGFLAAAPWRPPSDPEVTAQSRRTTLRRFIRYGSVSAISTAVSLVVLGILVGGLAFPALWANVIATVIGTVPSFELNRRWVWAQNGQRSLLRQALPFGLLSFSGLIISTIAVHLASDATLHSTRFVHTATVEIAVIGSYGALWLLQFLLCDRILFRSTAPPHDPGLWDEAPTGDDVPHTRHDRVLEPA
jgi:putative flippase GtrA